MEKWNGHEVLAIDQYGRQHIEVGGYAFTLEKVLAFEDWVVKKYRDMNAFLQLNRNEKETILLRWKWGLSDASNVELESSEKQTLFMLRDVDVSNLPKGVRFYFQQKIQFDRACFQIRRRIGIIAIMRDEELPEEAQRAVEVFSGRVV